MDYEDKLADLLINELMRLYGLKSKSVTYRYFYLRWRISMVNQKNSSNAYKEMAKFLLYEINISLDKNIFTYVGEKISVNVIVNIIENWYFRTSLKPVVDRYGNKSDLDKYLNLEYEELLTLGEKKVKKYKMNPMRTIILKYVMLNNLNSKFYVKLSHVRKIEGIYYPENHNELKRNMEEELDAYMHYVKINDKDMKFLKEKDVEDYIIRNLELIEEGMIYLDRQVTLPEGRVDVLAKDKDGTFTIIEIKVSEDKEIIWQCNYYPDEIRKMYKADKVRR